MTVSSVPADTAAWTNVDFLAFDQWRTVGIRETEFEYQVEALPLSEPSACPKCGGPAAALRSRGTQRQAVIDGPVRRKHVVINFDRRIYRCGECGRASRQPLYGVDTRRRATTRLVELIGVEAFSKTYSQISRETGAGTAMIRDIFIEKALTFEKTTRPDAPLTLGVGEAYIRGRARRVLVDLNARHPLEILPDRGMLTLCRYLLQMPQCERVEVVVIGLRRSDFEVVRRVIPQAAIVIDKWEVWQQARRTLTKTIQKAHVVLPAESQFKLARARRCLDKSRSKLTHDEHSVLGELFQCVPELETAYHLRRGFFALWNCRDRQEVEWRYDQWVASIPRDLYYTFIDFLTTVEHWRQEIFNYFDQPVTNAYTELINRKLTEAQQTSTTCSFETIRAKVLYERFVKQANPCITGKGKVMLKRRSSKERPRARRAPAPRPPSINDEKLRQAREAKDEFNDLLRPTDDHKEDSQD